MAASVAVSEENHTFFFSSRSVTRSLLSLDARSRIVSLEKYSKKITNIVSSIPLKVCKQSSKEKINFFAGIDYLLEHIFQKFPKQKYQGRKTNPFKNNFLFIENSHLTCTANQIGQTNQEPRPIIYKKAFYH